MKPEDLDPVREAMSSVRKGVRRKAQKLFGPFKYSLHGKPFSCSHCAGELFHKSAGQVNRRFATFFRLDWLDPKMTILICADCGSSFG